MTTKERTERLERLLDETEIRDCLEQYARGVDRIDEELIQSSFWPDAIDEHGRFVGGPDAFIEWYVPSQANRDVAQHFLMNSTVELAGDEARVETYFIAVARRDLMDTLELVGGRYLDKFARRNGEWRVHRRRVILDWQTVGDSSGMAERLAQANHGSRDTKDYSYALLAGRLDRED